MTGTQHQLVPHRIAARGDQALVLAGRDNPFFDTWRVMVHNGSFVQWFSTYTGPIADIVAPDGDAEDDVFVLWVNNGATWTVTRDSMYSGDLAIPLDYGVGAYVPAGDDNALDSAAGALLGRDGELLVVLSTASGIWTATGDGDSSFGPWIESSTAEPVIVGDAEWLPDGRVIVVGRTTHDDHGAAWVGLLQDGVLVAERQHSANPSRYAALRAVDVGPEGDVIAVGYQDGPWPAHGEPWLARLNPATLEIEAQAQHGRGWDTDTLTADRLFDVAVLPTALGGAVVVGTKDYSTASRGWVLKVDKDLRATCDAFTGCAGDAEWWEAGATVACDDGDPCTADSCAPLGCVHTWLPHECILTCTTDCPAVPGYLPECNAQSGCEYAPESPTESWQAWDRWIYVAPGTFEMGDPVGWPDSGKSVSINTGFLIQKYPVTVDAYEACVVTGGCGEPFGDGASEVLNTSAQGRGDHPQNFVDKAGLQAACEWIHPQATLPSESQLRYAGNGPGNFVKLPWGGNTVSCEFAQFMEAEAQIGCGWGTTAPVHGHPDGASHWGVEDLVGNLWEMTADCWNATLGDHPGDGSAWLDGNCSLVPLLGGGYQNGGTIQTSGKAARALDSFSLGGGRDIGGRCVRPLPDACTEREIPCDEMPCLTGASCNPDGTCSGEVVASWCFIEDACHANFATEAGNVCNACFAGSAATAWTPVDGVACGDDQLCTSGECSGGICGATFACDPSEPCLDRFCVPGVGCDSASVDCDDGDACTTDTCDPVAGCQHEPADCDDGNACTDLECDAEVGCVHAATDHDPCAGDPCNDGNACTADTCEFTVEACVPLCTNEPDDALTCDVDGLGCTIDLCSDAVCSPGTTDPETCLIDGACHASGAPSPDEHGACRVCDPLVSTEAWTPVPFAISCTHPCQGAGSATCEPATGLCVAEALADDGTPCADGLTCLQGQCVGCGVSGLPCPAGFLCEPGNEVGEGWCVSAAGGSVSVPGDRFWMGCNDSVDESCYLDEVPQHAVEVAAFEIDRTEVTAAAYRSCASCDEPSEVAGELGTYEPPEKRSHPINYVNWDQARTYCEERGDSWRLCSEAEWEMAARGGCSLYCEAGDDACCQDAMPVHPWGDDGPTCDLASFLGCTEGTEPVGELTAGASPYGALDMAGSVWEFVQDWQHDSYDGAPSTGQPAWEVPPGTTRVMRGGSLNNAADTLRSSDRNANGPEETSPYVGVRCCRPLPLDCDDQDVCTVDTWIPDVGCEHTLLDCDDGNPCTASSCDPTAGCESAPVVDGEPCGSGLCAGGVCGDCGQLGGPCLEGFDCEPGNDPGEGWCVSDDGGSVYVPDGELWMGCNVAVDGDCSSDEFPQHHVDVAAFEIDRTEATASAYKACGNCDLPGDTAGVFGTYDPAEKQQHPINYVDWDQAQTYCESRETGAGAEWRLCTEAEWEKAARGGCSLYCESGDAACCQAAMPTYPWGNAAPTCDLAWGGGCDGDTQPVGTLPAGASAYGVYDLAGNVWEWVQDWYHDDYSGAPTTGYPAWEDPSSTGRVMRGGPFSIDASFSRAGIRIHNPPDSQENDVGVRCCRSIGPEPCGLLGVPCPDGFQCVQSESSLNPEWSYCRSIAGEDSVFVPAGPFYMGCNTDDPYESLLCGADEKDATGGSFEVTLSSFAILRTQVSVAAYGACPGTAGCDTSLCDDGPSTPARCMSWTQAGAYCDWLEPEDGHAWRLCSEAEWEKAARGGCETVEAASELDCRAGMRAYPWSAPGEGAAASCLMAWIDDPGFGGAGCGQGQVTTPVDSLPDGDSVYGARQMSGNAWDWLLDCWHDDYTGFAGNPAKGHAWETSCANTDRGVRGASFNHIADKARPANRGASSPAAATELIGMRCCRDVDD